MARTLRTQSSIATLPYRPGDHAVPGEDTVAVARQAALGKLGWHREHVCTHRTRLRSVSAFLAGHLCGTHFSLPPGSPSLLPPVCTPTGLCWAGPRSPGSRLGGLGPRAHEHCLLTQARSRPRTETTQQPLSEGDSPACWLSGENDLRESPLPLSPPQCRIK